MNRIKLAQDFEISRIVHGLWRLTDWNLSDQELLRLTEQAIELGVTTFDHADIYGDYRCEKLFGDALALNPGLRSRMEIVTKCGIKLVSEKFPGRKVKIYDYSFEHIVSSVENSLKNFRTDHIDLLLLHRPAPFIDPEEAARAFSTLKKRGKVLNFGVSNFTPLQFDALNACTEEQLVTNQVEISPYCLDHFDNGNIDHFLLKKIRPMAWSPLAGGRLMNPFDDKGRRISYVLQEIAAQLRTSEVDQVAYSWLLKHPAGIIPVAGTRSIDRIRKAVDALTIDMSLEQWYQIYIASKGENVP
jgi:predicted oxidoreductase